MIPVTVFKGQTVRGFRPRPQRVGDHLDALAAGGARVIAWDDNEAARGEAAALGAEIADLSTSGGFSEFAALLLAPGVPLTHPEPHWTVKRAQAAGIEIIGDTELLVRQLAAENSGAKLVAITGTNGKSTTTALLGHVLKEGGLTVEIGGNIGTAVPGARTAGGAYDLCAGILVLPDRPDAVDCMPMSPFCSISVRTTWTGTAIWRPMPAVKARMVRRPGRRR